MRGRRAQNCLQRAHTALEAGRLEDCVEAFEEAQLLDPAGAGVQAFAQRLSALRKPLAPPPHSKLNRFAAVAAVLLALSGFLGWRIVYHPAEVAQAAQSHADIRLEPAAVVNELPVPPDNTARGSEAVTAPAIQDGTASRETAGPNPASIAKPAIALPLIDVAGLIGTVGLETAPKKTDPEIAASVPEPLPTTELVLPASVSIPSAPAVPLPPVNARTAATVPVSLAASAPDQRAAIRATLGRYEAAYSDLDVAAVQAVWPALDQRALAHAFDSLASQRVSLENCSIDVDRGSARANCSGTTAWTPKVGGGFRSTARKWVFDLSESQGSWHIVRVQAR
jgi:hypothetical protein